MRRALGSLALMAMTALHPWAHAVARIQTPAATPAERREAVAILRDLRQLADAALGDEADSDLPAGTPTEALLTRLGRPPRRVEPPGLDAAGIDRLVAASLASKGESPTSPVDDESFLRRASLDLTGTLPTPERIAAFAADSAPDKRARLVDELVGSEAFARHAARYWRDAIAARATTENPRLINLDRFEEWMTGAIASDRPWDAIVGDILTATGESTENGATALVLAHTTNQRIQTAELAGEASRLFLGVQIACAQCHDHPTDRWTQRQFHELTAYFAGATVRRPDRQQPLRRVVSDRPGAPRHAYPDKDDPETSHPVQPRFFLEASDAAPPRLTSEQARALAASYFTGPDNPWFARALVNRVWTALMGRGFYTPVDDLGPDRTPDDPALLDALSDAFARGGYDLRWLYRTIATTDAYARERPSTARLRPDALLDALVQAIDPPLGGLAGRAGRKDRKPAPQLPIAARGPFQPRTVVGALFGFDPSMPDDEVLGTIPQALFLMNGDAIHRATLAGPDSVLGGILDEHRDDPSALDAVYLRVLARHPNADERRVALAYVQKVGKRREAFEDLLWALVNSAEFLSRR